MSLLQKASIITTPTAYAEDYLYSIKPAEYLGAELTTNGGFDTDSDWTKGGGWTITGGEANANNIGSSYLFQTISNLVVGKTYSVTYTITSYTTGDVVSGIGNLLGSRGTTRNAAGTYTDIITFDTNTSNKYFGVFANNNFTGKIDNISIKEFVNADFDFDRNSTGTRVNEDYLIEDVPYNLLRHSESILSTTNWAIIGATTEIGYSDPQGTLNAVKVTPTGNDPYVYGNIRNLSYKTYTGSIYVKGSAAADGLSIRLWLIRDNVEFPFEDYTLTTEWQRLEITKTFKT